MQKCEKQLGVCQGAHKGSALCQAGKWLACTGQDYQQWNAAYSTTEVCDDKDNDCSGGADDGCIGPALFAGLDRHFARPLTTIELAGIGHWPHLEAPAATVAAIVGHLRAHP